MAEFGKQFLSGSTNGAAIKVTGTGTGSTVTAHTAHATSKDEIWIWAVNTSTADVKLTIEWATATAADGNIEFTVPAESGLFNIIPGLILSNSLTVKAFAGTADVILLTGFVNRIT